MSENKYSSKKNEITLNLASNEVILNEFKIIKITNDINEMTLTSNGEICKGAIIVKPRTSDLTINIENLKLHSAEHITIDFRGGKECGYKSFLHFNGNNVICSEENISICISNNQTVEIYGEDDSSLKAISGVNMPAIGSGKYSAGAGNITFSKKGTIVMEVAKSDIAEGKVPWKGRDGSYALGFYNEDKSVSSIRILDDINLKAVGEDGQDIKSMSSENSAGNGGPAVFLNDNDYFEKSSQGNIELIGGNGGKCIGEYSSGKCGNGGAALKISSGLINIVAPAVLKGGSGGSIEKDSLCVLAPGGNGGDGILVTGGKCRDERKSSIIIGDNVEISCGNGGNSGFSMNDEGITAVDGGNGGNIINAGNMPVELQIGNIKETIGNGGEGGCKEPPCKVGESGKFIVGENIVIKEDIEEIEEREAIKDEELVEDKVSNENLSEEQENQDKEEVIYEELEIKVKDEIQEKDIEVDNSEAEEVYNDDTELENNKAEKNEIIEENDKITESLTGEILTSNEEDKGLEVYKEEKKPNFIVRFFRWLFG